MSEHLVYPDVPRYAWEELTDPVNSTLVGVDEYGIEIIEGQQRHFTEPPLLGAPHRRKDSILLSAEELPETYQLVASVVDMNSDERRRVLDRTLRLISVQPKFRDTIFANLKTVSDPEIVDNESVIREAKRFRTDLKEKAYERGLDIFQQKANKELIKREAVTDIVERYVNYRQLSPEKRRGRIKNDARELLRDPDDIKHFEDTVSLLEQSDVLSSSGLAAQNSYCTDLTQTIQEVLFTGELPKPTAKGLERWVTLWAETEDESARVFLSRMISATHTMEATTDVLYDIALAGFSTAIPGIMNKTAELIYWGTDLMPVDSEQGANASLAHFSLEPETQQKVCELNEVLIGFIGTTGSLGLTKLIQNFKAARTTERFNGTLHDLINKNPQHVLDVVSKQANDYGGEKGLVNDGKFLARKLRLWKKGGISAILLTHGAVVGPLTTWQRDHNSSWSTWARAHLSRSGRRKVMAHLNLPQMPTLEVTKMTAQAASQYVQEQLQGREYDEVIEARTYWNTLGYLVPDSLDGSKWHELQEQNKALREEMITDKIHSLSPRGDRLEITSEALRKLGFDSVEFSMHPARKDYTLVSLRVGNATFRCYLDRNYTFRAIDSGSNLSLSNAAPFLEFVVLSHLHQIHCTESEEFGEEPEESTPTGQVEFRRAHRRVLQEGNKPSGEQIIKAWDEYGIDLVKQNKLRLDQGETQLITWVSQVKPQHVAGKGPVYNKGDIASERLLDLLI